MGILSQTKTETDFLRRTKLKLLIMSARDSSKIEGDLYVKEI